MKQIIETAESEGIVLTTDGNRLFIKTSKSPPDALLLQTIRLLERPIIDYLITNVGSIVTDGSCNLSVFQLNHLIDIDLRSLHYLNLCIGFKIYSPVDLDRLNSAILNTIKSHAATRILFELKPDLVESTQTPCQHSDPLVEIADYTGCAAALVDDLLVGHIAEEQSRSFDPSCDKPIRFKILLFSDEFFAILISANQLSIDCASLEAICSQVYQFASETPVCPSHNDTEYREFVLKNQWRGLDFYLNRMPGPYLEQVVSRATLPKESSWFECDLFVDDISDLPMSIWEEKCRQSSGTLFSGLLALLLQVYPKIGTSETMLVGIPASIDHTDTIEVGVFTNMLPLPFRLSDEVRHGPHIYEAATEALFNALELVDIPFDLLVKMMCGDKVLDYDIVLIVSDKRGIKKPRFMLDTVRSPKTMNRHKLTLNVVLSADKSSLRWQYSRGHFDISVVKEISASFKAAFWQNSSVPDLADHKRTASAKIDAIPHLSLSTEETALLDASIAIFRSVVNEGVGPDTDLLSLGADSVTILQAVTQFKGRGLSVSAQAIFKCRTPRQLILSNSVLSSSQVHSQHAYIGSLVHLTFAQNRFFCYGSIDPKEDVIVREYCLDRSVSVERLVRCIERVVSESPLLCLTFEKVSGSYCGRVTECKIDKVFRAVNAESRSNIEELIQKEIIDAIKQFDFFSGPLFRFTYVSGRNEARVVLVIHHILIDGYSLTLIESRLLALLGDLCLTAPGVSIPDALIFSGSEKPYGPILNNLDAREAFWSDILTQPSASLLFDYNVPLDQTAVDERHVAKFVDAQQLEEIIDRLDKLDVRMFELIVQSIANTLFSDSYEDVIQLDCAFNGRDLEFCDQFYGWKIEDLSSVCGYFAVRGLVTLDRRGYEDRILSLQDVRKQISSNPYLGADYFFLLQAAHADRTLFKRAITHFNRMLSLNYHGFVKNAALDDSVHKLVSRVRNIVNPLVKERIRYYAIEIDVTSSAKGMLLVFKYNKKQYSEQTIHDFSDQVASRLSGSIIPPSR